MFHWNIIKYIKRERGVHQTQVKRRCLPECCVFLAAPPSRPEPCGQHGTPCLCGNQFGRSLPVGLYICQMKPEMPWPPQAWSPCQDWNSGLLHEQGFFSVHVWSSFCFLRLFQIPPPSYLPSWRQRKGGRLQHQLTQKRRARVTAQPPSGGFSPFRF